MNSLLNKRYERESAFMPKQIDERVFRGDNRILIDGNSIEWLILDEDGIYYFAVNPHVRLRSRFLKKDFPNTYPRKDDYILKDNYCYGVDWRLKNRLEVYDIKNIKDNGI